MYKTDTLLLGASFFSIGYALTHSNCMILERRETIGFDYIACADISSLDMSKTYGKETNDLIYQLRNRKLLDDGGNVQIFPVSSVLSKVVLDKKIRLLFSVEVVSVIKKENNFEVKIFTRNGYDIVIASKLIDTRSNIPENIDKQYDKYLNAIVLGDGKQFDSIGNNDIHFVRGVFGYSILRMKVDCDDTYQTAREKLNNFLFKINGNDKIAAIALEFQYSFRELRICVNKKDGSIWIPSAAYGNFADAFQEGTVCSIAQ